MALLYRLAAQNNLSVLCFEYGQLEWLSGPNSCSVNLGESGKLSRPSLHQVCNLLVTVNCMHSCVMHPNKSLHVIHLDFPTTLLFIIAIIIVHDN